MYAVRARLKCVTTNYTQHTHLYSNASRLFLVLDIRILHRIIFELHAEFEQQRVIFDSAIFWRELNYSKDRHAQHAQCTELLYKMLFRMHTNGSTYLMLVMATPLYTYTIVCNLYMYRRWPRSYSRLFTETAIFSADGTIHIHAHSTFQFLYRMNEVAEHNSVTMTPSGTSRIIFSPTQLFIRIIISFFRNFLFSPPFPHTRTRLATCRQIDCAHSLRAVYRLQF